MGILFSYSNQQMSALSLVSCSSASSDQLSKEYNCYEISGYYYLNQDIQLSPFKEENIVCKLTEQIQLHSVYILSEAPERRIEEHL